MAKTLLAFIFAVLLFSAAHAQNTLFPANPGDMIVRGTHAWTGVPGGTAGCVLMSQGPTAAPTWSCTLPLNFQLPPTAPNTVWANVTGTQAPPTQATISQVLNTLDYDVQRPPLAGATIYKGTDNLWHTAAPPAVTGWVWTAQGTGVIPRWAPSNNVPFAPGAAGTCLVSNGPSVDPSYQSCTPPTSFDAANLTGTIAPGVQDNITRLGVTCSGAGGTLFVGPGGIIQCGGLPDIRSFGARCDGATDDSAAFATAISTALGVVLPANGTCIIDTATLVNNFIIQGFGDNSVLKRKNSAANPIMLVADGTHGVVLRNFMADGNKANNAGLGAGIRFYSSAYNFTLDGITVRNTKSNAGGGWGVAIQDTADQANGTKSTVHNFKCISNDGDGIIADKLFNFDFDVLYAYDCASALTVSSAIGSDHESGNISIRHVLADCNGRTAGGVAIAGGIASTGVLGPVYSLETRGVWDVNVHDVVVRNCGSYAFVAQAKYVSASQIITESSIANVNNAGVLFTSVDSILTGSHVQASNLTFGVDAGACVRCNISGNKIEGVMHAGGVNSTIANNIIKGNGTLIEAGAYDGDGSSLGAFSWVNSALTIANNKLLCESVSCTGINITDGMPNVTISGNVVSGTTELNSYKIAAFPIQWGSPNLIEGVSSALYVEPSATDVTIPENTTSVLLSGVNNVNTILTFSQDFYKNSVWGAQITNNGTVPYTSLPAITFTGGTCSVQPAASPSLDGNGFLYGLTMTTYGTCSVIPTGISITGGGGAGATAAVLGGIPDTSNGRTINIFTQNAINLGGGAGTNIFPKAAIAPSTPGAAYQFTNTFSNWAQTQ